MDKINILLIEDNPGDARLIQILLTEAFNNKASCHIAQSLKQAAETFYSHVDNPFDLVLLDLGLPDSQGIETLKGAKEFTGHVPIIIMTGLDSDEMGIQAMAQGAQDFIVKGSIGAESLKRVILYAIERQRTEGILNSNLTFLETLIDTIPNPVFYKDTNGKYLGCNEPFADQILGLEKNAIIGKSLLDFSDLIPADLAKLYHQQDMDLIKTGTTQLYEAPVKCADGKYRDFFFNKAIYLDTAGIVGGIVGIMQDISQRKKYEHRLELTNQILKRLNHHKDLKKTIRNILILIKESFSIDAVGIRLKDGDDYPYFETNGFADSFIESENYLCATDESGHLVRDEDGNPVLECMCGNILSGRTDPSLPFFTNCGSFWTNSTTELLASTSEESRQSRTRNRCHGEGYESVALVPLRAGNEIIGLMQLNHKQKDLFSLELIHFFESIGASIGIALDRMKTQKMIIESESRYRELIKNNIDAIVVVDQTGIVRYANPAAMDLFGQDKAGLLGQSFGFPIADKTIEIDIIKKNGTTATGEMRFAQTQWQGDSACIVTIQDISYQKINEREKKELETQLQQAQKMESIGTLAGGIAHDFNNILSAIIGFSELAMDRTDKNSDIRDDLSEVLNAGNRAKELVSQILAFSRQTDHETKPVRTDTIINEVSRLMRSTLPSTISIQTSIETSGEIMADSTRIHQVLMNLCTNAYHAMHDTGGTLNIALTAVSVQPDHTPPVPDMLPGNYINISITDTGTGIPAEVIPRIFDPYFTTKGQGEGTGLGLAVTHGVIKSHNGHIMVESESGRGTCFNIYFPAIKRKRDLSVAEPATELPRGTERILFVDDELPILKVNKIRLERLGYHVTALSRSKDAIDLFAAQPDDFDLIITDMTMPELTGEALAKECIRARSDIPIILCTGYSDIISETKAKGIGIREYVMKPILVKNLAEAIRRALNSE